MRLAIKESKINNKLNYSLFSEGKVSRIPNNNGIKSAIIKQNTNFIFQYVAGGDENI